MRAFARPNSEIAAMDRGQRAAQFPERLLFGLGKPEVFTNQIGGPDGLIRGPVTF